MKTLSVISILFIATLLTDQGYCSGPYLNPFPLGTIGCLLSDVCGSGEICTNDLLFGSCQELLNPSVHNTFHLQSKQIERLEKEIKYLIKAGFTWKDAYTQCTIQNILMHFSHGRAFNHHVCQDALGVGSPDWSSEVNDDIANVLVQLLDSGKVDIDTLVDADETGREMDRLNSHKRDEIVQVHKYFDKSTGQLKRDPFFLDRSVSTGQLKRDPFFLDRRVSRYLNRNDDLFDVADGHHLFAGDYETEEMDTVDKPSDLDRDMSSLLGSLWEDHKEQSEDTVSNILDKLQVPPEDQVILEQLLTDKLKPGDISPDQQQRVQNIVAKLIRIFEDKEVSDLRQQAEDSKEQLPPGYTSNTDTSSNHESSEDTLTESTQVLSLKSIDKDNSQTMAGPVLIVEKKTVDANDEDGGEDKPKEDPMNNDQGPSMDKNKVDSHSMYLQVSQKVNTSTGLEFVQNLSKILHLPEGLIYLVRVQPEPGEFITLEVNTDPKGIWDAEKIAKEAQNFNDVLSKTTGITVEASGIGKDGQRVELKQNNRYVVLTFILVGTIAGVLMAVVTIYLIKRHSRSKQKLTQLATAGDGNEASKDYQDLCRQRMQGKTSEKPEPLHAASRIGSVTETQVRSPSSRSSTSSWSEEPAATNMDISTGHIVLAYMEDHLKNQDRLDKEWEAVSSYVADPSSTKVALDPSNMRKNRFADILPYDHSRVILSSNANVSNSDYINASFITDHDPRNPAYICTQGPLPHTVADFWQMIWEQGSVVIVLLTKLAENGTSLCHRYWPEEGSDLYHIYEVHLVSEHIWCDDYLVRSFYLKNLQTNETRTVTQFHFLTWPELSVPASIKALLDFRRKVNKSFRGRSCPIAVHCSDGCGRSGTYCLIDMVLNKMAKGAKEIDMAATLEHIRDQRMSMVKTKEQFQFSLAAVAEEVHAILKALPQ